MRHLNYNHLLYFWSVIREGGIAPAAEALHVTPQTISGQIRRLEQEAGGDLFEKQGRRLVPTERGQVVFDYADEIFSRGMELERLLHRGDLPGRRTVAVGVSDMVPRLVAWRILRPLLQGQSPFRILCHAGELEGLLAQLAAHRLDLVLSASALPAESNVRAFNHPLGESDLAFFGVEALAAPLRDGFPGTLDRAPFLMPSQRSAVRRVLDAWLAAKGLVPTIIGEFDDSALIKSFGQGGAGIFVGPTAIEGELRRQLGVECIGRTTEIRARFFAISTERRIKHPAVVQLTEHARADLFQ